MVKKFSKKKKDHKFSQTRASTISALPSTTRCASVCNVSCCVIPSPAAFHDVCVYVCVCVVFDKTNLLSILKIILEAALWANKKRIEKDRSLLGSFEHSKLTTTTILQRIFFLSPFCFPVFERTKQKKTDLFFVFFSRSVVHRIAAEQAFMPFSSVKRCLQDGYTQD